jgi:hypothetical protein
VKVSKEVSQMRTYEEGLLKYYQKYLAYLEGVAKGFFLFFIIFCETSHLCQ